MKEVQIGNVTFSEKHLGIITGPCVIESRDHSLRMANEIKKISDDIELPIIFKSSFDKANRTSIKSFRGPGIDEGMKILHDVKVETGLPVITDIHNADQAKVVAEVVDVLQIPAFLSRQTDILIAASNTGKPVNIKKGQFLAPWDVKHIVKKIEETGHNNILLTDRGTQFGYNDLIVDFRGIGELKKIAPTILDVTHSVQKPNQISGVTGGNPEYIESLARAGIVNGIDGIFLETHIDPSKAKSDGANMLDINKVEDLLINLLSIREVTSRL